MSDEVNFSRRYVPKPEFKQASFIGLTETQIRALPGFPFIMVLNVDPTKPYRRVWAWILRDTGNYFLDYDLVCTMNGQETYRQKLAFWSQALGVTSGQWVSNIATITGNGSFLDNIVTRINTTLFTIVPWQINVTCDTMYIEVNTVTLTGANIANGGLFVQSQVGI